METRGRIARGLFQGQQHQKDVRTPRQGRGGVVSRMRQQRRRRNRSHSRDRGRTRGSEQESEETQTLRDRTLRDHPSAETPPSTPGAI